MSFQMSKHVIKYGKQMMAQHSRTTFYVANSHSNDKLIDISKLPQNISSNTLSYKRNPMCYSKDKKDNIVCCNKAVKNVCTCNIAAYVGIIPIPVIGTIMVIIGAL